MNTFHVTTVLLEPLNISRAGGWEKEEKMGEIVASIDQTERPRLPWSLAKICTRRKLMSLLEFIHVTQA